MPDSDKLPTATDAAAAAAPEQVADAKHSV